MQTTEDAGVIAGKAASWCEFAKVSRMSRKTGISNLELANSQWVMKSNPARRPPLSCRATVQFQGVCFRGLFWRCEEGDQFLRLLDAPYANLPAETSGGDVVIL